MTDMPGTMAKGELLDRLDNLLSTTQGRADALQALRGPESTVDLAWRFQIIRTAEERRHLEEDWFGSTWWPKLPAGSVEQIVRAGLITAIEQAQPDDLPVDTYWICHPGPHNLGATPGQGGAADQHIEAATVWSEDQVTFVIHTPERPNNPPQTRPDPVKIWVWDKATNAPVLKDYSREPFPTAIHS